MATQPFVNILHLRSVTQNAVPVNLEPGQIALSLYDAINPDANGNRFVEVFIGTGDNDRRSDKGVDRTADALVSSLSTGESLITGKGWVQTTLGGEYTPTAGLNLAAASVTNYQSALDTLDTLVSQLISTATPVTIDSAAEPATRVDGNPLQNGDFWVDTTATNAAGDLGKLCFWNQTRWTELATVAGT